MEGVSINESKERTSRLRAKQESLEKSLPLGFYHNHDEDLKMIGTCPIESLFSNVKIDNKGTGDESALSRRRPNCSEGDDANEKVEKGGFGEVKTFTSDVASILDYNDFNYESFSLVECISLLQSIIISPNAYEKTKLLVNI